MVGGCRHGWSKLAGSAHQASHLGYPAPTPGQGPSQPLLRAAKASRSGSHLPCVRTPRWPGRRGPAPPTLPWRPLREPCRRFWRCRSRAASHYHPVSSRTSWFSPLSPRLLGAPTRGISRKFRHEWLSTAAAKQSLHDLGSAAAAGTDDRPMFTCHAFLAWPHCNAAQHVSLHPDRTIHSD